MKRQTALVRVNSARKLSWHCQTNSQMRIRARARLLENKYEFAVAALDLYDKFQPHRQKVQIAIWWANELMDQQKEMAGLTHKRTPAESKDAS